MLINDWSEIKSHGEVIFGQVDKHIILSSPIRAVNLVIPISVSVQRLLQCGGGICVA